MIKADQTRLVAAHDRVTFDSDEGIQAGYVNGLRRDVGNGEMHAWVELDHQLPGMFRAVPLSEILTCDRIGPPSGMWLSASQDKASVPVEIFTYNHAEFQRLYACHFEIQQYDLSPPAKAFCADR